MVLLLHYAYATFVVELCTLCRMSNQWYLYLFLNNKKHPFTLGCYLR